MKIFGINQNPPEEKTLGNFTYGSFGIIKTWEIHWETMGFHYIHIHIYAWWL